MGVSARCLHPCLQETLWNLLLPTCFCHASELTPHCPRWQAGTSSSRHEVRFLGIHFGDLMKLADGVWPRAVTLSVSLFVPGEQHFEPESFRTLEPPNPTELFIPAVLGLHTDACRLSRMSSHILTLVSLSFLSHEPSPTPTPFSCQPPGLTFSLCLPCLSLQAPLGEYPLPS